VDGMDSRREQCSGVVIITRQNATHTSAAGTN
jgi:hypothetical protein